MKILIIFFLKKIRDWYNLKIDEYQSYLNNLELFSDYVGADYLHEVLNVAEFENQLAKYQKKRHKVSEIIKKLKQR